MRFTGWRGSTRSICRINVDDVVVVVHIGVHLKEASRVAPAPRRTAPVRVDTSLSTGCAVALVAGAGLVGGCRGLLRRCLCRF